MDLNERIICHLSVFLDKIENDFDNDPAQIETDVLIQYLEAAKDLSQLKGRINHRIEEISDYLIFTQAV